MAIDPYEGDAAAYAADLLAFDETIMGYAFGPEPRRTWRRRRRPTRHDDYICHICNRLRIDGCGHPRRPRTPIMHGWTTGPIGPDRRPRSRGL